jgi:hypothetical protein
MKIFYKLCSIVGFTAISLILFNGLNKPVFAQFRGQDSQQFFDRGNQLIEQQIQQLQQENLQQLKETPESKPENIESTLELKKSDDISIEEVASPDKTLEENVPESPTDEIQIKTN